MFFFLLCILKGEAWYAVSCHSLKLTHPHTLACMQTYSLSSANRLICNQLFTLMSFQICMTVYSVEHQGCNIEYYTGHSFHAITVNWRFKKHHWMWSIRLVHYIPSLMNPCTSFVSTDRNLGYLMMIFVHKSILQGFVKRINWFNKKYLTSRDHKSTNTPRRVRANVNIFSE